MSSRCSAAGWAGSSWLPGWRSGWEGSAHTGTLAGLAALAVGALAGWVLGLRLNRILGTSFRLFNAGFDRATKLYTRTVGMLLRVSVLVLLVYGGLLYLTYLASPSTPTGFIPAQDKGYLLVNVQLPDATSVEHTQRVMKRDREAGERDPRRPPHRGDRGAVAAAERQRAELRVDVRDAR